jgi:DNA-binding transcriptional LysR family regulator
MRWDRQIGRRLKLRDLHILMAVAQTRGIGKAAGVLNMSQPAVSNAIADLERAVGHRLLDRGRQGVEPTPFGLALIQRGIAVFDELRAGIKDIEFLADPTAGEIHIGLPALASGFVAEVISRLSRSYPRIKYRLSVFNTEESYRALEQRKVDLVLIHFIRPISKELMNVDILFYDPHVVAAATDSRWTRQRKLKLRDLMDEPWALPVPDTPLGSMVSEAFQSHGLEVPQSATIAPLPVRYPLLATGRFLTILPRIALTFPAQTERLKALPIDLSATRRPFGIVTLKNRTVSPVVQLFITHASEVARPLAKTK